MQEIQLQSHLDQIPERLRGNRGGDRNGTQNRVEGTELERIAMAGGSSPYWWSGFLDLSSFTGGMGVGWGVY